MLRRLRTFLKLQKRFHGIRTMTYQYRYVPTLFDNMEDIELYHDGGFHPVSIGDTFSNNRYRILHKLGYGESSIVWLARDQRQQDLVSLKILLANESSIRQDEHPELVIPAELDNTLCATGKPDRRRNFHLVKDHFMEKGPNGTHLCIVSQFGGPSVSSMLYSRQKIFRWQDYGDVTRKLAKQMASTLELVHSAGLVHGDLTLSNILFRVSDQVLRWSDEEVYRALGEPETENIQTCDGSPAGPCAPRKLISPTDNSVFSIIPPLLQEDIILTDFGQSFAVNRVPKDYAPYMAIHYAAPEVHFECRVTTTSDIWGLACAIFELRAGYPLFDPFLCASTEILMQTVQMLGKLPEPWWSDFQERYRCFRENGEPEPLDYQERDGLYRVKESGIRQELREIGRKKRNQSSDEEQGLEPEVTWPSLEEEEVSLLGDLLEKMLKYRPEERVTAQEVLRHPWFDYTSS